MEPTIPRRRDISAVLTTRRSPTSSRGQVVHDLLEQSRARSPAALRLRRDRGAGPEVSPPVVGADLRGERSFSSRASSITRTSGCSRRAGASAASPTPCSMSRHRRTSRPSRTTSSVGSHHRRQRRLRQLLVDRDAPLEARVGLTTQLLEGKVNPVSLALARFTILLEDGRATSSGTARSR